MSSPNADDDDRTVIRPVSAPPAGVPAAPVLAPAAVQAPGLAPGETPMVAPSPDPVTRPAAPPMPGPDAGGALPVGTRLAEFELTSVLGEGGFGIVYLAWDHSLQRRVALKEYIPSSLAVRAGGTQVQVKSERHRETFEAGRKSFVNEARLLAQFDHPSLVKVYRFWEANGTAYMVMPFYEGSTLKSMLAERGSPPDEAWLLALLAPLTEALAVIHAENCYHRDIAPDNIILLAGSGRPLLLDFGAARRVIGDMTQALTVILKPGYAPVEQYADTPGMKQGPWTDIYALAASVYYAILGRTPPPSVGRLMADGYQPLATTCAGRYSERFLQAIDRALQVRPEERTPSIAELRADLGLSTVDEAAARGQEATTRLRAPAAASLAGSPVGAPARAAAAPAAGTPAARRPVALWAAAGGALLLAAAAAWWWSRAPAVQSPAAETASTAPATAGPAGSTAAAPVPAVEVVPPPVAALPTRLDVPTEFRRVLDARSAGFEVQVTQIPSRLRADRDLLTFTVVSSRDGDLTVLAHGPDDSLIRLVPDGGASSKPVRVKAGVPFKIPNPAAGIQGFPVSEPLGANQLLFMVSGGPLRWERHGAQVQGGYLQFPSGDAGAQIRAQWSSARPYLAGEPAAGCTGADCEAFGATQVDFEIVR